MNTKIVLPGAAWVALITFGTAWLTQYFGEFTWVPAAVAVGGGVVKMLTLLGSPAPSEVAAMPRGADGEVKKPNAVVRFFVG